MSLPGKIKTLSSVIDLGFPSSELIEEKQEQHCYINQIVLRAETKPDSKNEKSVVECDSVQNVCCGEIVHLKFPCGKFCFNGQPHVSKLFFEFDVQEPPQRDSIWTAKFGTIAMGSSVVIELKDHTFSLWNPKFGKEDSGDNVIDISKLKSSLRDIVSHKIDGRCVLCYTHLDETKQFELELKEQQINTQDLQFGVKFCVSKIDKLLISPSSESKTCK